MRGSAAVVCIGIGISVGATAYAQEPTSTAEQGPDIALLEYLGNLVEEHDTLIGPDDMKGPIDPRDAPSPPQSDDHDAGE
ncbi:MAG TPA: hypothetical protein VMJ74_16930 [Pseudomonadales bacterium]|nr:hypothetical protein [Pseudomonadales bacterium]